MDPLIAATFEVFVDPKNKVADVVYLEHRPTTEWIPLMTHFRNMWPGYKITITIPMSEGATVADGFKASFGHWEEG